MALPLNRKETIMSNTTKPSLIAFSVREREKGKKPVWIRLGAAWAHREGEGYNLELEALPVNFDGRLVLMPPKAGEDGGAA